jgi:phosphoglycolate phosphatase
MPDHGVIFDFDGTLVDTLPDLTDAVNAGLEAFGLPTAPAERVRTWIGEGLPLLCRRAAGDAADVPIDEMATVVTRHYRAHRLDKTKLFPGMPELLDALVAREVSLAIVTNKPHEHTVAMVESLCARWSFVAVEGYREERLRKPDPTITRAVIDRMKLAPEGVLFVGDSATDIHTARSAGAAPVGVTWGYRDRDELLEAGAALLLDRPADLLGLV